MPRRLPVWGLWAVGAAMAVGVLLPLGYLILRASEAEGAKLATLVLRRRNAWLLWNTAVLAGGVLAAATVVAFPLAWLTARTDIPGKRLLAVLAALPLAIPGYVMAFSLLAASDETGAIEAVSGLVLPQPSGYWGALVALSLTTFPYLFLNLRSGMLGVDPALEESARALGCNRRQAFLRVVVPQLRPAYLAGSLLIVLHVLGDFGVVSLMRFETFSYAIYLQYTVGDRTYSACLALMLLSMTAVMLLVDAWLLWQWGGHQSGPGTGRRSAAVQLGWRGPVAWGLAGMVVLSSVGLPLTTVAHWAARSGSTTDARELVTSAMSSVMASAPAALVASSVALALTHLSVRRPSRWTAGMERLAYLGYATPPLAFALAMIFLTVGTAVYQTLALLIFAYALHFLAEAIGPVRTAMYQAPQRLEDAARSLGRGPVTSFVRVTLPLLRRGLLVSTALVFLSAIKELPMAMLLSPPGFRTLAMNAWDYTSEAMFAHAAPHALGVVAVAGVFVAVLLIRGHEPV